MKRLILFLSLIAPALLLAEQPTWQPARTWVFAVGVLKFDNLKLATWPDEGRVDAAMLDAFRQRGVPDGQIVFIKNEQATKANVTRSFDEFLRKPGPGDMLVFYYAGHGGRDYHDAARTVSFMTYDTAATWTTGSILDSIEFLHDLALPRLSVRAKLEKIVLHPVCSLQKMKLYDKNLALARACAHEVLVPEGAGCCGMAGDRGFFVPELSQSALKEETASVLAAGKAQGYFASACTCESALSEATGLPYRSMAHLVQLATGVS